MKAHISRDAWEPFYYIDLGIDWKNSEIPDELVIEYDAALVRMDAVQVALAKLFKEPK